MLPERRSLLGTHQQSWWFTNLNKNTVTTAPIRIRTGIAASYFTFNLISADSRPSADARIIASPDRRSVCTIANPRP
jgi:hypothetical protein